MLSIFKKKEEVFDINNLSKKFLEYIDVAPKTIETYKIALRQFANYMTEQNIKNPTREDIINYRESIKEVLKPTTVNSYMIALRSFFQFLSYEGIYKNIAENVKGVKLEKRHLKLGLSDEELEEVLNLYGNKMTSLEERTILTIKFMFTCGLRVNELVNIRLKDFYRDGDTIMLKVLGKGRDGEKQDVIKVDERLFDLIKKYVEKYNITDYLFVSTSNNNYGNKLTTKTIRLLVKDVFKKSNLDDIDLKSCHSLRHTTTEKLLKNNVSIEEVSQYMRHKSIQTTMIYSKELDQKESNCSNILADSLF